MPLASEVALELRKLADSLDAQPDAVIAKGSLSFYHSSYRKDGGKEEFLTLAKLMPRPLRKSDGVCEGDLMLTHDSEVLEVYASIPKSLTCELVEPAKAAVYRCISVLSPEEEAEMEAEHV